MSADKVQRKKRHRQPIAVAAGGLIVMGTALILSRDRISLLLFAAGAWLVRMGLSTLRGDREERERRDAILTEPRLRRLHELRAHLPETVPDGWSLHAEGDEWVIDAGRDRIGVWTPPDRPDCVRVVFFRAGAGVADDGCVREVLAGFRHVGAFRETPRSDRWCRIFEAARRSEATTGSDEALGERYPRFPSTSF
jgi:hypothetical protein